jgi:hypothetical protein
VRNGSISSISPFQISNSKKVCCILFLFLLIFLKGQKHEMLRMRGEYYIGQIVDDGTVLVLHNVSDCTYLDLNEGHKAG